MTVLGLLGGLILASPASATPQKLAHSANITADCGEVTLTFENNHSGHTYTWNIQTSDGLNYNVPVPSESSPVEEVVIFNTGEGSGWVSYGVVSGPESDYYLANKTKAVTLCSPEATTPVEPEVQLVGECGESGYITIPEVEGVDYLANGEPITAGASHNLNGEVTITVEVQEGYELTEGDWTWTYTFEDGQLCEVEDPTCETGEVLFVDTCVPDLDCDDQSQTDSQTLLEADENDPHGLDADGDGVACEVEEAPGDGGELAATGTPTQTFLKTSGVLGGAGITFVLGTALWKRREQQKKNHLLNLAIEQD